MARYRYRKARTARPSVPTQSSGRPATFFSFSSCSGVGAGTSPCSVTRANKQAGEGFRSIYKPQSTLGSARGCTGYQTRPGVSVSFRFVGWAALGVGLDCKDKNRALGTPHGSRPGASAELTEMCARLCFTSGLQTQRQQEVNPQLFLPFSKTISKRTGNVDKALTHHARTHTHTPTPG